MTFIDPLSVKRFHRKGFKGHKVKPPKTEKTFFPPQMTNHDKMIWRKEQRELKAPSRNRKK